MADKKNQFVAMWILLLIEMFIVKFSMYNVQVKKIISTQYQILKMTKDPELVEIPCFSDQENAT